MTRNPTDRQLRQSFVRIEFPEEGDEEEEEVAEDVGDLMDL